jgi:glycosyltransferase involved in cell wall biosynthesis
LQQADLVTTTHHRLAEKITPHNKNVVILPNAIPQQNEYFTIPQIPGGKLRLFWQGSITHERDIALLRNPVKRLNKNNYTMVMAGHTGGDVWQRMAAMYTNSNRLQSVLLPGIDPTEYYSHYSHADICLVPLTSTPFNALKSNLKILEAANLGLPVIASHVQPYTGMAGVCYVHKQQDWHMHIQALANVTERQQRGHELQQFCARHYNHTMINLKRKECFT